MGNCFARFAFKPDHSLDDDRYERFRPITKRSSLEVSGRKKSIEVQTDDIAEAVHKLNDIFEPQHEDVNSKEIDVLVTQTEAISISADPVDSNKTKDATKKGISEVLAELEVELVRRTDWLTINPSKTSTTGEKLEILKRELDKCSPKVLQVNDKNKRRRVSSSNSAGVDDEDSSAVELKLGSELSLHPAQDDENFVKPKIHNEKRSSQFKAVKYQNRYKNRNRVLHRKNSINNASVKAKERIVKHLPSLQCVKSRNRASYKLRKQMTEAKEQNKCLAIVKYKPE